MVVKNWLFCLFIKKERGQIIHCAFIYLQDCELLVLQQLQWEISTVTPTDFLDHILLRLGIDQMVTEAQMDDLKIRMETILALAVTEYTFSYLNPSLLAASTIQLVLSRFTKSHMDEELNNKLYKSISAISVSTN